MIKIILADDHLLVRNGIKMLLESRSDIEVIAEFDNGKQVISYLEDGGACDMLITDITMPEMNGFQLAEKIQESFPAIKVIFLTMLNERNHLLNAFNYGAKGYLVKNISYDELLFAVKHISNGGQYLCDGLSQQLISYLREQPNLDRKGWNPLDNEDISERELEVLSLIAEGYTNNEIAEKLFLSKRTIEGHRQNLIDKTGTKNSASLIKYAVLNGLIN